MKRNNSFEQNTARTAVILMVMTLVSKFLGFGRELVIAGAFGTSYVVDALVLAQSIPSILLGGILGSIGTAYIPVYSKLQELDGEEKSRRYTFNILNLSVLVALVIFGIGMCFSSQLVDIFTTHFSQEAAELTSFYLKVAFSYAIFSCGISILDAFLQYNGQFYFPVVGGYLYNVGIIIVALISARTNIYLLAFGTLVGYILHFTFDFIQARKIGLRYQATLAMDVSVKRTFELAMPVFFSSCMYSINTFVDKALASGLQEGSIAALNYGHLLVSLITGLTSSVVLTILYPKLTQAASRRDFEAYQFMMDRSASVLIIVALPFMLGIIAFSQEAVQVVFERGAFDGASTTLTASAFLFYGVGLLFLAMNDLMVRVCYTMQDTKTPILCAAVSIAVNIVMDLLLVQTMDHRGLALATSLAALTNMLALSICVHKRYPWLQIFPKGGKLLRIAVSATAAVGAAILVFQLLHAVWMPRICYLGIAVLAAAAVYLVLLVLLKIEEVGLLKHLFK